MIFDQDKSNQHEVLNWTELVLTIFLLLLVGSHGKDPSINRFKS